MYRLHLMATDYATRPSQLVGVRNKLIAYWFDEAIHYFGLVVAGRLRELDRKGQPKYTVEQALGLQPLVTSIAGLMLASGQDEV